MTNNFVMFSGFVCSCLTMCSHVSRFSYFSGSLWIFQRGRVTFVSHRREDLTASWEPTRLAMLERPRMIKRCCLTQILRVRVALSFRRPVLAPTRRVDICEDLRRCVKVCEVVRTFSGRSRTVLRACCPYLRVFCAVLRRFTRV